MRVIVTFINGTTMHGKLREGESLADIMNHEDLFIPFIRPNGTEVQLNKASVAYVVEEIDYGTH